jgi:hypothetical protein
MRFHQSTRSAVESPAEHPPAAVATVPARRTFNRLRMAGLSTDEAGNLTAHLAGLRIARQPWTVAEIERLRFLRSLVETGRLSS